LVNYFGLPNSERRNTMSYMVYDEEGGLMRVVGRQEEARQLAQAREGWTFKCVRKPKEKIDLSQLEEAPF
jgi:hypothetical protein